MCPTASASGATRDGSGQADPILYELTVGTDEQGGRAARLGVRIVGAVLNVRHRRRVVLRDVVRIRVVANEHH
jgi:hypothetical protein